jgi:ligand-binding sensor domain-containing protein
MVIDSDRKKWFGTANGLCQFDAKNQPINITTFEMAERIKTNNILAIQPDQSHALWCATEDGLARYKDGTWYIYNYNDGLPANFVSSIYMQNNGKKYVGFRNGGISILRMP